MTLHDKPYPTACMPMLQMFSHRTAAQGQEYAHVYALAVMLNHMAQQHVSAGSTATLVLHR